MSQEAWKPVSECPTLYEVSNLGNVRPLVPSRRNPECTALKPHDAKRGYLQYRLYINKQQVSRYAHRLVAQAFVGPQHVGHEVNHLDGNKHNNRADNLEWVTRRDNLKHARAIGLPNRARKITQEQASAIRAARADGASLKELARQYGIVESNICVIAKGRTHKDEK